MATEITPPMAKEKPAESDSRILLILFILTLVSCPLCFLWGMLWSYESAQADLTLESLSKMGVMLIPLVLAFLSLALAYLLKRKNPLLRVNKNLVAGYLVALASLALSLSGFIPMANHDFSFVSAVGEEVGLSFPKEDHIKRETIEENDAYSRSLVYFTNADEAEAFSAEVLQSSLWFSSSEELDPLLYQKDFYLRSRALYVDRYSLYNRTEKNINKTPAASGVYSLIEIEHIAATPYLAIFEYRLPYSAA